MDNLYSASKIKEIINNNGFNFKKKFGQNFLIDKNILDKIINATEADGDSVVLEIGPGIGTLAVELAKRGATVYAIEIDSTLIPILEKNFELYPNIKLIHGDALKVDYKEILAPYIGEKKIKVAANLPYYITTPLIFKILETDLPWESITLMMQLEVAQRICAKPGGKDYGSLTVAVNYYGKPTLITKVPSQAFFPSPKVDSAVLNIKLNTEKIFVKDQQLFFKIIKTAFNQRRKTLLNNLLNLGKLNKEELNNLLKSINIDGSRRAESLTIEEFALLTNAIYNILGNFE
ncbi:16S rRNA (adenine1518-N6/adenine1519-N6)-dimethyltransferase [Anaerobranca californiensis DSM 14826]|jgi:16S rRNA (adenine1518-N6/adenine1519-N6)-dimethyltransferase|uniref:Ribosomal RNA small subunit methyltransferase A n=1 Tax=Anaerobranca californiensis DSM 14826 TaxID=1120989 RepID=A0A1M6PKU5_9FIRM|nr:16S rRNA (adenine(1518)-N(6)/adenine(1519)-N(6))-dimethyltransferase RsmA [Anaerobranca californiensis]SHK08551.1 16S rRNA (adenine1518-N6/adenine1519-N6)-dimethyltransferase [Anaerobranca californiensis DSM 14826]